MDHKDAKTERCKVTGSVPTGIRNKFRCYLILLFFTFMVLHGKQSYKQPIFNMISHSPFHAGGHIMDQQRLHWQVPVVHSFIFCCNNHSKEHSNQSEPTLSADLLCWARTCLLRNYPVGILLAMLSRVDTHYRLQSPLSLYRVIFPASFWVMGKSMVVAYKILPYLLLGLQDYLIIPQNFFENIFCTFGSWYLVWYIRYWKLCNRN